MIRALSLGLALLFGAAGAQAQMMTIGVGGAAGGYAGPCDGTTGCAEAWSLARAMTVAYAGPLFQLGRSSDSSTLDIPQTAQHTANLSGVYNFCKLTYCWYNTIYRQIQTSTSNNNLVDRLATDTSLLYCDNGGVHYCKAPFWIDPFTGYPVLPTVLPAAYNNINANNSGNGLTGIIDNPAAQSVIWIGRDEWGTSRSGHWGPGAEEGAYGTPTYYGDIINVGNQYGNTFVDPVVCTSATSFCMFVDYNSIQVSPPSWNQVDYSSSPGFMVLDSKLEVTPTNQIWLMWNGTQKFTVSPPATATYSGGLINHAMWLGSNSGSNDHSAGLFYEGILYQRLLSNSEDAAVYNNANTFYSAGTPAACTGVADYRYFIQTYNSFASTQPISSTRAAWALYPMGATQTGPIVTLRDVSTLTTQTYGRTASGCNLDPAAATFCATHGCSVAKLFNQAWYSTTNIANIHDGLLDLTAASTSAEPTVTFNSLNGRPTMHFSGSQKLCTGTWSTGGGNTGSGNTTIPMEQPWSLMAVARRTGSTSTQQAVISHNSGSVAGQGFLGFDSVSGGIIGAVGGIASGTKTQGTGVTENHWHAIDIDNLDLRATGGTASGSIWADGVALASKTQPATALGDSSAVMCLGDDNAGGYAFTGDIAEASVPSGSNSPVGVTPVTGLFPIQEAIWGTLPN
jgi:Alpha-L-arabinofuranosidase B, catalytic